RAADGVHLCCLCDSARGLLHESLVPARAVTAVGRQHVFEHHDDTERDNRAVAVARRSARTHVEPGDGIDGADAACRVADRVSGRTVWYRPYDVCELRGVAGD